MAAFTFLFLILQALLLVSQTHAFCQRIAHIPNGQITYGGSYTYYRVSCRNGYMLVGNHRVLCERGEWDNSPPICIPSICEELLAPKNGRVECDEGPLSAGKACRLSCLVGYKLKGSETRICMLSGTEMKWSGLETECSLIFEIAQPLSRTFCPLPQPLIHGTVIDCSSQNMPRINSKCSFKCNNGYILSGPSSLTCTPSGRYADEEGNENFPECVADNGHGGRPVYNQANYNRYSTSRVSEQSTSAEVDHNPCKNLGGCQHICKNDNGQALCRCRYGFTLAADQKSCVETSSDDSVQNRGHSEFTQDLSDPHRGRYPSAASGYDENRSGNNDPCFNHQCQQLCLIENGRAQCRCRRGFVLNQDQRTCRKHTGPPIHSASRNPCSFNKGGCQHKCQMARYGQIKCGCFQGYYLAEDGRSCIAIATRAPPITCDANNGGCEHFCAMTRYNTVVCTCSPGYRLHTDGKNCIAQPARRVTCDVDNGGCEDKCSMRGQHVICSCRRGYRLRNDRKSCIDIDECKDERLNSCHHFCVNTEGGYTCHCRPGYVMTENKKCEGCRKHSYWSTEENGCVVCPDNSFTESDGKSSIDDCFCQTGFTGSPKDNIPCIDIDECASENFGCSHECVNAPGHAYCSCPFGYTVDKDNKTCIDIDECSIKNGGCEGECTNTDGSFFCRCPVGYVSSNKDIYSCIDIDECQENNGGCQQLCINHRGGYYCACEDGYRLDSSLKNCTDISCSALPIPHFSTMICKKNGKKLDEMDSYPTGTICSFKCIPGFKDTSESNRMKCQEDGTWEGSLSKCKSQRCPPLNAPENGDVHPSSCSTEGNSVKQKCTFTCRQGYKLKGISVFSCKNNLTWNHAMNEIPVCQPEEIRASMECTRDVKATLLPGKSSHNVTIPEPSTNMDSYEISPVEIVVGKPMEFKAGRTRVTFTTSSPSSNRTAKCITTVHVIDEEPPVFLSCPDPIVIENAKIDGEIVTWEEPEVTDNVKVESLKPSVEPNTTLIPGSYVVEYVARDPAGNAETCRFNIDIIRLNCDNLTNPAHGEANCMDWLYGTLCQPECDYGYMRNPSDPPFYSCGDSGIWEPSDKITDCLAYTEAISSVCPDGTELKIIEETDEELCLECPSNAVWSSTTLKCEDTTE